MGKLDDLVPSLNIDIFRDPNNKNMIAKVVINGQDTPGINGEISQTLLSTALRLECLVKDATKAHKEIMGGILEAMDAGVAAREGSRRPVIEERATTGVSYKNALDEVVKDLGWTDEETTNFVEKHTNRGVSRSVKIKSVK